MADTFPVRTGSPIRGPVRFGNFVKRGGVVVGPLDIYSTNAVAGWSMRALKKSFLGANIGTVRRLSDNATIALTASATTGYLSNAAAVTTFLGASRGLPFPWKDQVAAFDLNQINDAQDVYVIFAGGELPAWTGAEYSFARAGITADFGVAGGSGLTFMFACDIPRTDEAREGVVSMNNGLAVIEILLGGLDFSISTQNAAATDGYEWIVDTPGTNFSGRSIVEIIIDGTTTFPTVLINGVQRPVDDGVGGAATPFTTPAFGAGTVFYSTPPGSGSGGQTGLARLNELLFFKSALSNPVRTALRNNMAAAWGVTL